MSKPRTVEVPQWAVQEAVVFLEAYARAVRLMCGTSDVIFLAARAAGALRTALLLVSKEATSDA